MDWYSIIKFLHVLSAVIWLGGGFMLSLIAMRAERAGNAGDLMVSLRNTAAMGNLVFMPASMATLASGLLLAFLWTGFSDAWIIVGLAGAFSTFAIGAGFFKPTADRIKAITDRDGVTPAAMQLGRRMLQVAKFDYMVMAIIIADMVLKPGWSDYVILGAFGALFLASAIWFLIPRGESELAAA